MTASSGHRPRRRSLCAIVSLTVLVLGCSAFRPDSSDVSIPPSAEELLKEGDSRLAAGDFDGAAASFARLLETQPHSELAASATFQLASIYLYPDSPLYEPDRGRAILERLRQKHSGAPVAVAAEAVLALMDDEIEATPEPTMEPLSTDEVFWQGNDLLAEDDDEGAAEAYYMLLEGYPDSPHRAQAMFTLGVIHLDPDSPAYDRRQGAALLADLEEQYPDSSWSVAAAAVLSLSRSNIDLRRAVAGLREQLDQIKKIDLDSDG